MEERGNRLAWNRRRFVQACAAAGWGGGLLAGTLTAVAAEAEEITPGMVAEAARLAGLSFSEEECARFAQWLNEPRSFRRAFETLRSSRVDNHVPLALVFHPLPAGRALPRREKLPLRMSAVRLQRPSSDEDLAFLPVTHLAHLVRTGQVSSLELTQLYLERLKRYDPLLHCVVTLTEELAFRQARRADREIRAGRYRGPLHGIPWGCKDLLAVRGYPTTWGASPFRDQVLDFDATVYRKLTEAGAVLVAKLSTGALAVGDRWFKGQTKNPWDPRHPTRGSSGSSAGPAAATAAGLVGFSIGTETRGSIISPASRCGVTGLRPTFGLVSRYGAMTLSWSMDKIGPICRSAEDCALVLEAMAGPDGRDHSVLDIPFNWDAQWDVRSLRVGYLPQDVEGEIASQQENPERARRAREERENTLRALEVIRGLGVELQELRLPDFQEEALSFILSTESAAVFDDLVRSGRDQGMRREPERSMRPDLFRYHRLVPAVEYLRANQVRSRLMAQLDEALADLDVVVGSRLALTNLTGHPEITLPSGFDSQGQPTALRLTGNLFAEAELLLLAHAYQERTGHHRQDPRERLRGE